MDVSPLVWGLTLGITLTVLLVDLLIIGRRPHEPSMKEAGIFVSIYASLAVIFGLGVWWFSGPVFAGEFFAGWITEYSLSIDNLFIFIIIMGALNVPRHLQQFALMIGIVIALVLRGIFIALGAALINAFAGVFFLFGAILIYTAVRLVIDWSKHDEDNAENGVMRFARRVIPFTDDYRGTKLFIRENGRRVATPMLMVIIALGSTDLLFALDSIPAIYGLTQEPYLVFAANVFALMGLRQLYFLIGGLLKRLVYLSLGLSVILAFIGVKLFLHALHSTPVLTWFGMDPLSVPEIPTWLSLIVIIGVLIITAVASLLRSRGTAGEEVADTAASTGESPDDRAATSGPGSTIAEGSRRTSSPAAEEPGDRLQTPDRHDP
ncbi:TerC family protein [Naumannella halotolerans]|uniref:Tellurite resistance protein TerC n=1 Tax=Naumannella halotolerans TaxID=993414 RepID=A0A4R7J6H0_9ACTN|nr:TerC family protein [Naumannella halotolerans]TDT32834.1 tellurite resistance protein TerC [Naumannella halotolerans]